MNHKTNTIYSKPFILLRMRMIYSGDSLQPSVESETTRNEPIQIIVLQKNVDR